MKVSNDKPLVMIIPPEKIPSKMGNIMFLDINARMIDSNGGIRDNQVYSILKF